MSDKKIIIAIDGHSSCGKSTMAKSLAQKLGYVYIDTGAMYRVVTLVALRNGWIENKIPDNKKVIEGLKNISISFQWDEHLGKNTTFLNACELIADFLKLLVCADPRFFDPPNNDFGYPIDSYAVFVHSTVVLEPWENGI